MGVGGNVVLCAVGVAAGEGVSGASGIIKNYGHVSFVNVCTKENLKVKFTRVGPRRDPSENIAAGGRAEGTATSFGEKSVSEPMSQDRIYVRTESHKDANAEMHRWCYLNWTRGTIRGVHGYIND